MEHIKVPGRRKMIRTIYKNIAAGEKNGIRIEIEQEITDILSEEKDHMDQESYERYRDRLYQAVSVAEEGGFVMGFRYAVDLLMECTGKRGR
jgi:hypothetical protein